MPSLLNISRDCVKNGKPFHILRLLVLYHDPELCSMLDTKRVTTDSFAQIWFRSLFAASCSYRVILTMWDVYLQHADPFLLFYLALVILINARDQILEMAQLSGQEIIEKITSFPGALEADDIEDFCSLAQYYSAKTPQSFRLDYQSVLFGSSLGSQKVDLQTESYLKQALCLSVSVTELLQANKLSAGDGIKYFLVDCRPAEQYNTGHLATAFHLDACLMLQNPSEFATTVQALIATQQQAISSNATAGGEHLCFMGSGREEEDQYTHMVIAHFLQRHSQYVSLLKGGYLAVHEAVHSDLDAKLIDHNHKLCIACSPNQQHNNSDINSQDTLIDRFGKLSSVVKSKSAVVKEKMINYIKNDQPYPDRHVSSSDNLGKRYRNMASVFTIDDEDEVEDLDSFGSEDEHHDVVNLDKWLSKPEIQHTFECKEVDRRGNTYPAYLCLTNSHLYLLREVPSQKGMVSIQSFQPFSSILKITSKKRHPEFITFKYGQNEESGTFVITRADMCIIPRASDATAFIKQQIIKCLET